MSTIRIVADMLLKPGVRQGLMPVFQALVTGSRAEAGNREYELTASMDNADHLIVIETWASEEAITEHNASPHFQAFVKAVEGKVETMRVTKVQQVL